MTDFILQGRLCDESPTSQFRLGNLSACTVGSLVALLQFSELVNVKLPTGVPLIDGILLSLFICLTWSWFGYLGNKKS